MDLSKELSVKGYCFREFKDNKAVAQMVLDCGLDRIDLSGCQLNYKNPDEHGPAIEVFTGADVKIVGIGAVQLSGDPDDEEYFKFCRKAGCDTISVSGAPETFPKALEQAGKWAEEYGMKVAIHNHGGYDWMGNSKMLKYIFSNASDNVGLCLDTAWAIQAGEDPVEWLDMFKGRIFAVHFKDFTFDKNGKYEDVIVGEGALALSAFVKKLIETDFAGPAIIEYEADKDNPVPALTECVGVDASRPATPRTGFRPSLRG